MIKADIVEQHESLGEIHIRNTTPDDVGQCIKLLSTSFNSKNLYKHAGRVAIGDCIVIDLKGEIIAVIMATLQSKEYDGAEIDYAIVKDEYRHNGLMTRLFDVIIKSVIGADIYIKCWYTNGDVHIKHALDVHGFKMIKKDVLFYDTKYMRETYCKTCPCRKEKCKCGADLYYYQNWASPNLIISLVKNDK